jgi:hypothetical protein
MNLLVLACLALGPGLLLGATRWRWLGLLIGLLLGVGFSVLSLQEAAGPQAPLASGLFNAMQPCFATFALGLALIGTFLGRALGRAVEARRAGDRWEPVVDEDLEELRREDATQPPGER